MVLFCVSTFNLTYFGLVNRRIWLVIAGLFAISLLVLVPVAFTEYYSPDSRRDLFEIAGCVLAVVVVCVFSILGVIQARRYRYLNTVLERFYDTPKHPCVFAMRLGVILFSIWTITFPIVIFLFNDLILYAHCLLCVFAVFVHRIGFFMLGIDGYAEMYKPIKEATVVQVDRMANDSERLTSEEIREPISSPKIDEWVRKGGPYRTGITVLEIASEVGITTTELRDYFRSHGIDKPVHGLHLSA